MVHRYLPLTQADREAMLQTIGVASVDELFEDIPKSVQLQEDLYLQPAKSESELLKELQALAAKNANTKTYTSFLGAGVYDHYSPVIVDHVISRSEFYTAYTPYQPEISQGELQAIFEFQTMICELTGMDVANSSMYDGGTALAEAAMLAGAHTKKKKILISKGVHPEYRDVVKTVAKGQGLTVMEVETAAGITDLDCLAYESNEEIAGIIVQYPNFFGRIEPLKEIEKIAHRYKGLFIVSSNPLALGALKPPGHMGADIVTGDAQVFGIPPQYGGPHCGYFAVTHPLMRKIPGRLVGQTVDTEGRRGYVLTLQAREQHIRRDKATSNICSNQALNALAASVAMSALGKEGMKQMALLNIQKAHYLKKQLLLQGIELVFDGPMFNEFVIKCTKPISVINQVLFQKGIIGGYDLGKRDETMQGYMLVAVTELRTKEEMDTFVKEMGALL